MASGAGWLLALCAACCLAVRGGCSDVEVPWNEEFALQHDIKYNNHATISSVQNYIYDISSVHSCIYDILCENYAWYNYYILQTEIEFEDIV